MKKICIILAVILIFNTCAFAAVYDDIESHWAKADIEKLSQSGIIEGYEGKFCPDNFITRGEAAVILNRIFCLNQRGENNFFDLDDTWYTDAILCLNRLNIMQGDGEGRIYADANISKQEALCLIAKAFYIDGETEYIYTDASYDNWATEYVSAVAKRFALPNSFFDTDLRDPITRAETVYIINHLISTDYFGSGRFSINCDKSVVINGENVVLSDMTVGENIIIGENAKNAELSNVDAGGKIVVLGTKSDCGLKLDFVTSSGVRYIGDENTNSSFINKNIDLPLSFDDVANYSTVKNGYGQGNAVDSDNRPLTAVSLQEQYKNLGALFIGEKSDKIYLTFDEGYENGYTSKILDVLKEKNCTAVFFVTMDYAKKNPDLIRRMIDEGHVVGNHSVNHYSMPTLSDADCANEIINLHKYMRENFDYEMYLFRPPMGEYSERSLAIAQKLGYKTMLWSFAYRDWLADNQPDKAYAKNLIAKKIHGGGIFLLHAVSKTNTEILGDVIDDFRYHGYTVKAFELGDK
ncbi:MAG: polysaccharide deacetylase family protein [Oscillospiraceae bacterium]|nr:polysaccharide deacetylase family protein [Oscillospiraceae bacterium]